MATIEIKHDHEGERHGFAGMHDLLNGENINRVLKSREKLVSFDSIFLKPPPSYSGKYRVLLVQGPHDERAGTILFPLGLGYVARMLVSIGCTVEVLDAHAERFTPEETLRELRRREFDIVGITALSTQYGFVKWFSAEVKKSFPDAPILLGAQLAHYNWNTVLKHTAVDICVLGEGEITVQDVIYHLDDLSGVAGIAYKEGGVIHRNPDRPRIFNPALIPFPYYDAFNMDFYFQTEVWGAPVRRAINILSSRGCPYSCTFCSLSFPNVTYRHLDNVIEEIRYLKETYGVDGIVFCDELFVINKKRVFEFCERVKPLKIHWGGQGRANIVDKDYALLRAMKDSGCLYIGFGLESATSEILSKMQKKTTVEQNKNSILAAQEVGLHVVAQYMFGFPGESLDSIKAGVEFFKEVHYCPPDGIAAAPHISLTTPLPGSQLYEDCKKSGMIVDEDAYLEKITTGYFHNKGVVVNLTDFTDEEIIGLKQAAEDAMWSNYVSYLKTNRRFFFLGYTLKCYGKAAYYYFLRHGFWRFSRKVAAKIVDVTWKLVRGRWRSVVPQLNYQVLQKTDYVPMEGKVAEFKRMMQSV
jgi:radical SAM superfamily enzyme YgiQ (UPF0313 family)